MKAFGEAVKWLHIVVVAIIVPISVAGHFPPPQGMSPFEALFTLAWLAVIGGLAGYGLWKLP